MWMVCGYAEARQVLSDPRFSRGAAAARGLAGTPTRRVRNPLERTHLPDLVRSQLVVGWQEASRRIVTSLLALLEHGDQLEVLRQRPSLLPRAVEELLHHDPHPASSLPPRLATEDIDVTGTLIPDGAAVVVPVFAANRDPRAFPAPDTLDITRPAEDHLAFGQGAHYCPGAHLVRATMRAALNAFLALPAT
ncbi:cytochrome P450 [Streptomyces spectabilis]|uniref:cytochrome P450 n=1 Tax=Streptomyces spectabilis TaxID=68270 RepID=UPI0033DF8C44